MQISSRSGAIPIPPLPVGGRGVVRTSDSLPPAGRPGETSVETHDDGGDRAASRRADAAARVRVQRVEASDPSASPARRAVAAYLAVADSRIEDQLAGVLVGIDVTV